MSSGDEAALPSWLWFDERFRRGRQVSDNSSRSKSRDSEQKNVPEREDVCGGTSDGSLEHRSSSLEPRKTLNEEEPQHRAYTEAVQISIGSEVREQEPSPGSAERQRRASPSSTARQRQGSSLGRDVRHASQSADELARARGAKALDMETTLRRKKRLQFLQ